MKRKYEAILITKNLFESVSLSQRISSPSAVKMCTTKHPFILGATAFYKAVRFYSWIFVTST
jgi:hypothetical protein